MEQSKIEIAIKQLSIGLAVEQVIEATGLTVEEVSKIQEQV